MKKKQLLKIIINIMKKKQQLFLINYCVFNHVNMI